MSQWLEKDFLGYLKEWEDSVKADVDSSDGEKPKMLLSIQTMEGLIMSGKSGMSVLQVTGRIKCQPLPTKRGFTVL